MKHLLARLIAAGAAAAVLEVAAATPPAGLPAGTTALCNDGSTSSSLDKRGACRGHRGIKEWFGPPPSTDDRPSDTAGPTAPHASAAEPGRVWVNDNTRVYHCPGDKYYGKTASGYYLSEADARKKGFHANQNNGCSEPER